MSDQNPYIQALTRIPAGSTRSFAALAALAGRPSAARAAGRAVASIPDDDRRPWQRIVDAGGGFAPIPERARLQLERLRAERARPRAGESVMAWAKRVRASWVGDWRRRTCMPRDDERVAAIPPDRVEAFASCEEAEACGFRALEAQVSAPTTRAARSLEPSAASRGHSKLKGIAAVPTTNSAQPTKPTRSPKAKLEQNAEPAQKAEQELEAEPATRAARAAKHARVTKAANSTKSARASTAARSTNSARLTERLARAALAATTDVLKIPDAPDPSTTNSKTARERLDRIDWDVVRNEVLFQGASVVPSVLDDDETAALRRAYEGDELFERTIEMAPRGYGVGRYRYLREPIPEVAARLRARLYAELRSIASSVPGAVEYPLDLERFFERCRTAGQKRASSIVLRYERGGINHPHRDIYGAEWFPFQALVVLSRRGTDFDGGEFELHERALGGGRVTRSFPLDSGDLCVFASKCFSRTERGTTRWIDVDHGMSPVTRGERLALGLVLHMAE